MLAPLRASLLFIFFFSSAIASAQIRLQFVDNPPLDASRYPRYSARVKASFNGTPFLLSTSNVLVQEDVLISTPVMVSSATNDIQTVEWYSRTRDSKAGRATLIAYEKNSAVSITADSASGLGLYSRIPQIRLTDFRSRPVKEISFGNVAVGDTSQLNYFVLATTGKVNPDGSEERVTIDSIKTESEFFIPLWRGGVGAYSLPGKIHSPLDYSIGITFRPKDDKYYHDVLTIYYEGGAVERIALSGNVFALPMRTILNITSPNGREFLAPCQKQKVSWTGALTGSTTIVEFSIDEGKTWAEISRTKDSSLVWDVPDTPSDNVQLRVRAEQENLSETDLRDNNSSSCDKICFSPNSSTLVAAYRNGEALEWDMTQNKVSKRHTLRIDAQLNSSTTAFGSGYISNSTFFIAYRSTLKTASSDTLSFFNSSTSAPLSVVALDTSSRYKAALIDSTRSFIVMVPKLGTRLRILSASDGSFQREVVLPQPVSAVSLSIDKAVVALLDGKLLIYALPDWTLQKTISVSGMPLVDHVLILSDNARIAVGCHATAYLQNEGAFSDTYIVDIATSQIVRTQRKSSSSPLCVSSNATARYVIFGYVGQPQAPLWDISPNQLYGTVVSHGGALSDLAFSPSGTLLASAANASDNLSVKQFIYPEIDYTDAPIRIIRQTMNVVNMTFDDTYAFSSRDSILNVNLCNNGLVPVVIGTNAFEGSTHFKINSALSPDTVMPGSCLRIPMKFFPLDTGLLKDAFHVESCRVSFKLPIEGYAIPRKLNVPDTVDFGDVCPNSVVEKEFKLISNSDPVPVVLNRAFLSDGADTWFTIVSIIKDDTVAANGSYTIKVRFNPLKTGVQEKVLLVYYGGQRRVFNRVVLRGRGAGSEIVVQPNIVGFITEEPRRSVTIHNPNDNPIIVNALDVVPAGPFILSPVSLPYSIAARDSLVLNVRWADTSVTSAKIEALIAPCSAPLRITLQRYVGISTLSLPQVTADPRGDAIIPLRLRVAENAVYGAERTLQAEFSVNPRMFIPQSISSWLGKATLTRNDIVNDQRIIGFSLRANFPSADTIVAEIRGAAGLAETDRSALTFNALSSFFGNSVNTSVVNGELKLINLCSDRRLIQDKVMSIVSIAPTPAHDNATLSIASTTDVEALCEVYAASGEKLFHYSFQLEAGTSLHSLDCQKLLNGSYTIVLRSGTAISTSLLLISR